MLLFDYICNIKDDITYAKNIKHLSKTTLKRNDLAVVVHLYYPEVWSIVAEKLKNNLDNKSYDLYITTPKKNVEYIENNIKKDFPNAMYLVAPNRGRDVLPFIIMAKYLLNRKYLYFLKLQTKKSTHWEGGSKWLMDTLNNLIPENINITEKVLRKLENPSSSIIGVEEYYYPLTINFDANGKHISHVLCKLYDKQTEKYYAQSNRNEYGFFAGTMFWGRLDTLQELYIYSKSRYFERECGQIDGTFAHALERLFCLVPEINDKNMHIVNIDGLVRKIDYSSRNIPEWSDLYTK